LTKPFPAPPFICHWDVYRNYFDRSTEILAVLLVLFLEDLDIACEDMVSTKPVSESHQFFFLTRVLQGALSRPGW